MKKDIIFSGCLIKEFRKKKGLTRRQLADAIGANVSTVSGWENGSKQPGNIELMNQIATIFDCSIQDLCEGDALNLNPVNFMALRFTQEEQKILQEALRKHVKNINNKRKH